MTEENKHIENIGPIFRELRQKAGFSVKQVTQYLNENYNLTISVSTVYGWENGIGNMPLTEFFHLCQLYGITSTDIFKGLQAPDPAFKPSPEAENFYRKYHTSDYRVAVDKLLGRVPTDHDLSQ